MAQRSSRKPSCAPAHRPSKMLRRPINRSSTWRSNRTQDFGFASFDVFVSLCIEFPVYGQGAAVMLKRFMQALYAFASHESRGDSLLVGNRIARPKWRSHQLSNGFSDTPTCLSSARRNRCTSFGCILHLGRMPCISTFLREDVVLLVESPR